MGRQFRAVPSWGVGSSSNTMWPGPRPTSVPSGILIQPAVWPQHTWAENWAAVSLWGGGAGSPYNVAGAQAYLRAKFHLDPSQSFGHNTSTSQTDRPTTDP